ncbi:MAG: hypothetical protein JOZ32_21380 [Bryobacterales bacterium]|nr:hypothetical protein [Bryobacterales bacterium]
MQSTSIDNPDSPVFGRQVDVYSSGVSWGAVIGGAFVAAALSLIMLALGAGFGLSAVSPWANVGASASTVGATAIIWLIFTEIVASSMGGYLAGRLRTRWRAIHTDEVHFRDTANGFLVWAVAVVVTVAFLGAGAAAMVGSDAASGDAAMAAGASSQDTGLTDGAYFVDRLFRSAGAAGNAGAANNGGAANSDLAERSEASRILAHSLAVKETPAADTSYLAQLVAAKTGLNASEAQMRVSDTVMDLRQAADNTRKATAHFLLWIFLTLLIGAFCASYAATIGGRQRDHVQVI